LEGISDPHFPDPPTFRRRLSCICSASTAPSFAIGAPAGPDFIAERRAMNRRRFLVNAVGLLSAIVPGFAYLIPAVLA